MSYRYGLCLRLLLLLAVDCISYSKRAGLEAAHSVSDKSLRTNIMIYYFLIFNLFLLLC